MDGPFKLDAQTITAKVTRTSAGYYVLSQTINPFVVQYVGRSDADVSTRLHAHVDAYKYFKFAYATSPKDAFENECKLYHAHRATLDNEIHPRRPDSTGWKCPICKIFG